MTVSNDTTVLTDELINLTAPYSRPLERSQQSRPSTSKGRGSRRLGLILLHLLSIRAKLSQHCTCTAGKWRAAYCRLQWSMSLGPKWDPSLQWLQLAEWLSRRVLSFLQTSTKGMECILHFLALLSHKMSAVMIRYQDQISMYICDITTNQYQYQSAWCRDSCSSQKHTVYTKMLCSPGICLQLGQPALLAALLIGTTPNLLQLSSAVSGHGCSTAPCEPPKLAMHWSTAKSACTPRKSRAH